LFFLQVGEGLNFLHNDAKKIHHNLCPHNIIVSHHGAWKIFGFDFSRELVSLFSNKNIGPSAKQYYLAQQPSMSGTALS
jgi:Protein kinase domain.